MPKKALWILLPFLIIFLLGLALLLRPQYQVQVTDIVETFTRQEKAGQRSSHRHAVAYAAVKVTLDGKEYEVTVHDNAWEPLKAGDTVVVTRGAFGRIVEYRTRNAYRLMACAAIMGPVCVLGFWVIARKKRVS